MEDGEDEGEEVQEKLAALKVSTGGCRAHRGPALRCVHTKHCTKGRSHFQSLD